MLVLQEISRLRDAWEKRYPNIPGGGATAIGGFHYQFLVTLLAAARRWKDDAAVDNSRPGVFGELLSDIVAKTSSGIIVSQVKKTLRSDTLHKALQDLWCIYDVAQSETPDLILSGKLRFRIASARSELKGI
jgi:hypothetical protein